MSVGGVGGAKSKGCISVVTGEQRGMQERGIYKTERGWIGVEQADLRNQERGLSTVRS